MDAQLAYTFTSSIFIGGAAAYMGTLMLSRKMTIVADPISHLTLPGAALAIIYGFDMFLGIFPSVLAGTALIWFLGRKTRLPMENLTAVIFAIGVGSALLILPVEKAEEALVGNIEKISFAGTCFSVLLSIAIIFVAGRMYNKIMMMNINEDIARTEGIKTDVLDFVYLISIALVVGLGVYLVGGLITAALVAIPAGASKNISKSLGSYKRIAIAFGVASAAGGVLIALVCHLPAGPAIIVINALIFVLSLFIPLLPSWRAGQQGHKPS